MGSLPPGVLSFLALSGMDIGHNQLSPISERHEAPFAFTGHIERVAVHVESSDEHGSKPLDD
ncbi:MAG: hypothetical protein GXP36_00290 [Actinobacteria bacterium]|nr:hypothetical protein [Actinomycetota bacterium]